MRSAAVVLLPAMLVGAGAAAQGAPADYRAVGTEPFWALTIDARAIRLTEPGRRDTVVARPIARPSFNGERYVTRGMTVDVTHARCSDGMSDRTYRDTVTVQVGQRTLRGCGGAAASDGATLANSAWTVWQVNGTPIHTYQPLTVRFSGDRIEGKLCNGFGGDYRQTGERLQIERVIATRMACRGPAQLTEGTLFRMWQGPTRAIVSRSGTLTLSGGRDTVTLRPARR